MFGYVVARDVGHAAQAAKSLHYLGAAHIFADEPKGNVRHRKGYIRARKVMRAGDMLILSSIKCLGRRREYQQHALIDMERRGITVNVAK